MQKGDKKDGKLATSVEIVDAPPRVADNESILKTSNLSAGATNLSEEELPSISIKKSSFFRDFVKRWFPSCHSSLGRNGRRFNLDKHI